MQSLLVSAIDIACSEPTVILAFTQSHLESLQDCLKFLGGTLYFRSGLKNAGLNVDGPSLCDARTLCVYWQFDTWNVRLLLIT